MDVNQNNQAREVYNRALRASHKEAAATLIAGAVTAAFFWAAIILLQDSEITVFSFPLWFIVSCVGGYLLSVVAVIYLVRRVFVDIDLDKTAQAMKETMSDKEGYR